jgi:hypothetical protein
MWKQVCRRPVLNGTNHSLIAHRSQAYSAAAAPCEKAAHSQGIRGFAGVLQAPSGKAARAALRTDFLFTYSVEA